MAVKAQSRLLSNIAVLNAKDRKIRGLQPLHWYHMQGSEPCPFGSYIGPNSDAEVWRESPHVDHDKMCAVVDPIKGGAVVYPVPAPISAVDAEAESDFPAADVRAGRRFIAVYGCLAYITADAPHHSSFC